MQRSGEFRHHGNFSELLNEDTFSSTLNNISTSYMVYADKNYESYSTSFLTSDNEHHTFVGVNNNILSEWMMYLDYGKYPDENSTPILLKDFMAKIKTNLPLSPNDYTNDNFDIYVKNIFDSILNEYKISVSHHSFFQQYFSFIYDILRNLHCILKNLENCKEYLISVNNAQNELCSNISKAIIKHNEYREYVNQAIISPIKYGRIRKTSDLIINYECYMNYLGKKSIFAEAMYSCINFIGEVSWEDIQDFFSGNVDPKWRDENSFYSNDNEIGYIIDTFEEIPSKNDYTFLYQFAIGIKYLIAKSLVLKKCELCDRYFINKFNFRAKYCNVPYRTTKATCQEYISRHNYKKRTTIHPINTEYNKVYNRVYSRVRRGSMTELEAKFDQLKKIRDSYMTRYDSADELEKSKLLTTFINEINSLYSKR